MIGGFAIPPAQRRAASEIAIALVMGGISNEGWGQLHSPLTSENSKCSYATISSETFNQKLKYKNINTLEVVFLAI
jgi:hypothetical protein